MSLTLMPAVDVRDGKAVRLRQGESGSETDYGSPFEAAVLGLRPVPNGFTWSTLMPLSVRATIAISCEKSFMSSATA